MARENVARFTADGRKPRSKRLCRLLEMAAAGDGTLLRLSTRRSVFLLSDEGRDWILKLDAPERPFEALRARLRRPPLARESRNWQLLSERWPVLSNSTPRVAVSPASGSTDAVEKPGRPPMPKQ